jgi:hypothetical protein
LKGRVGVMRTERPPARQMSRRVQNQDGQAPRSGHADQGFSGLTRKPPPLEARDISGGW